MLLQGHKANLKVSDAPPKRHDISIKIQKAGIGFKKTQTSRYTHYSDKYALGKNATHKLILKTQNGGTTDPPPGTYYFPDGTQVNLKGISDSGHFSVGFEGHIDTTDGDISFPMDGNKIITAEFGQNAEWSGGGGGGIGGIKMFSNPDAKSTAVLVLGLMLLFILAFWVMVKKAPISSQYSS